jgi:hypothetical protein
VLLRARPAWRSRPSTTKASSAPAASPSRSACAGNATNARAADVTGIGIGLWFATANPFRG